MKVHFSSIFVLFWAGNMFQYSLVVWIIHAGAGVDAEDMNCYYSQSRSVCP